MGTGLNDWKNRHGLTLFECVLALALGVLVLVPLTMTFRLSEKSWSENDEKNEFVQHARVAMNKITTELRYATALVRADSELIFDTTNLLNNDPAVEQLRYWSNGAALYRTIGGLPAGGRKIAGFVSTTDTESAFVTVTGFLNTPLKLDGANNLVPLVGGDPLSDAVAVRVDLTIDDADGEAFFVNSTVHLRNL